MCAQKKLLPSESHCYGVQHSVADVAGIHGCEDSVVGDIQTAVIREGVNALDVGLDRFGIVRFVPGLP